MHNVDQYLSVHGGGARPAISAICDENINNMQILSNEPGYYKQGEYGIRIENLICLENNIFKDLTFVPHEIELIDFDLLDKKEITYLINYHKDVNKKIGKYLRNGTQKWLKNTINVLEEKS